MSTWYVFASLGFYPVNPVSNEYMISSLLLKNAVITLKNGKKVGIKTNGNRKKENTFNP
ncbi:glycoside hydrolase domain-containing protein [Arcticibacter svalbardensis]|nr:glycoside hydrolase domain-containing protein [Arcticibacter svalbardensis]